MDRIPTLLVCGFLDSGKTTYINQGLKQANNNSKILVILTELGEEELDTSNNVVTEFVEYSEDFNRYFLKELVEKHNPDKVIIEANGMWQMQTVQPGLPNNLKLIEMVTLVDANTFDQYSKNFNSLMYEKIRLANTVIFTKVNDDLAKELRKKNVRLINNTTELFLDYGDHLEQYDDGTLRNENFKKEEIFVEDDEYGYWFSDFTSDPSYYLNKTITLRGSLVKLKELSDNQFVIGRSGMVCCANDMVFLAMMCNGHTDIKENSWIEVKGKLVTNPINPNVSPYCIEVISVEQKPEIADPIVY